MSARSFGSLFMVATCAGAALSCYLVSLRVASERAALENAETKIVLAQRDIRLLQTEIGTRGRLAQLERWNVKVLALSAPSADQFLSGSFELAKLTQPEHKVDFQAPVVLASAPAPKPEKPPIGEPETDDSGASTTSAMASPRYLLHEASLKTETREVPAKTVVAMPQQTAPQFTDRPATAAKPAIKKSVNEPGLAAAQSDRKTSTAPGASHKKSVDKPELSGVVPMTKPVRLAKADPLAPIAGKHPATKAKDIAPAR
jgi:hypothetical protein